MDKIHELGLDDLQDEYLQLQVKYQHLSDCHEADQQRIYELKRGLETATAAEAYLANELEQLTATNENQDKLKKTQSDYDDLKRKYDTLQSSYCTLQQECDILNEENTQLRDQIKLKDINSNENSNNDNEPSSAEYLERLSLMERENGELLQKIEEFHAKTIEHTMAMAERDRNIEILKDQINCLEENMRYKRDELEEKTQLLESTQEQLVEANAEIARFTSTPENSDRKGNSLFAEVDDQRQVMKQLLAAQKKNYLEMKKIYQESEHEIRRLKRENRAMQTELQACSTIFCNADKIYQRKLNERICNLSNQNEELERKLQWSHERLKELADGKGVPWLDSMLNFCKQETDDLKKQLRSVRMQKASVEEQLRNTHQDMARWRFESLKSRCLLLDRENLLTEHKIIFKSVRDIEFKITESEISTANPRIVTKVKDEQNNVQLKEKVNEIIILKHEEVSVEEVESKDLVKEIKTENAERKLEKNAEVFKEIINEPVLRNTENFKENIHKDIHIDVEGNIKMEIVEEIKDNKENIEFVCESSLKALLQENSSLSDSTSNISSSYSVNSLPKCNNVKNDSKHLNIKTFANMEPSLPVTSILSKERDMFESQMKTKNVKFSKEAAIIHNISTDQFEDNPTNEIQQNDMKSGKTLYPQRARPKSNVIIRRVVVGSSKNRTQ